MADSNLQIYALSSPEQIIELLGIYMEEWRYRNSLFWNQLFLFFVSALIVFMLPYMEAPFKFDFESANIPESTFTITGILLSILFVYISIGNAFRSQSSRQTYMSVALKLPEDMRPVLIGFAPEDKNKKCREKWKMFWTFKYKRKIYFLFSLSFSITTTIIMFFALIALPAILNARAD